MRVDRLAKLMNYSFQIQPIASIPPVTFEELRDFGALLAFLYMLVQLGGQLAKSYQSNHSRRMQRRDENEAALIQTLIETLKDAIDKSDQKITVLFQQFSESQRQNTEAQVAYRLEVQALKEATFKVCQSLEKQAELMQESQNFQLGEVQRLQREIEELEQKIQACMAQHLEG